MGGTQIKDSPSLPQLTRSTDTVANRTRPEGPLTSIEGPSTSIEGPLTSSEGPSAAHEFPALERNAVVASSADATSHASRAAAAAAASAALAQNPPSSGGLPRNSWSLFEYTLSAVGQDDDRIIAATAAGPALQVESAALRQRLRDDASLYVSPGAQVPASSVTTPFPPFVFVASAKRAALTVGERPAQGDGLRF